MVMSKLWILHHFALLQVDLHNIGQSHGGLPDVGALALSRIETGLTYRVNITRHNKWNRHNQADDLLPNLNMMLELGTFTVKDCCGILSRGTARHRLCTKCRH